MELITEIGKRGQKAFEYLFKVSAESIHPKDPLRDASEWYVRAGGKGFRPAMMQISCGALGGEESTILPAAAAIEAVHVASLIHDDFMDKDETRRGVPTVWKKWDPTTAILAGDALIGIAFQNIGEVDVPADVRYQISRGLASVWGELCHGQMLDIKYETTDVDSLTIDDIKSMHRLKTGVLFEFSCVTGAQVALKRVDDPQIDTIREYAKLAGTAFQMQDDIIGLIGDEEKVGKPIGSDIKNGKRTLIAIHTFNKASDEQKAKLKPIFGNQNASDDDIQHALAIMKDVGSIDYVKNLAIELAEKAKTLIEDLPENENSELLKEFASYMIYRDY